MLQIEQLCHDLFRIKRPSLMSMPKEMEPHYGPNRTHRDVDPELEVLTLPVEDEYTEAYLRGKEAVSAGATMQLVRLIYLN